MKCASGFFKQDQAIRPWPARAAGPVQRKPGKWSSPEQPPAMNLSERITVDPEQCGGKPCIRGIRICVKDILEMLGSGMTDADILNEFPYLEAADLRAAQLYAARQTDHVFDLLPPDARDSVICGLNQKN